MDISDFCRNHKGFSLLAVIMVAGMVAGLALIFADLTRRQQVVRAKAETAVELINLSQRISSELYNRKSCKNTIGTGLVFTPTGGPWPHPVSSIKNRNNEPVIEVGGKYGNGFLKIHSMELKLPEQRGNVMEAKFEVVLEKKQQGDQR